MIEVKLPWPPTTLSPNSRLHWAKLMKHKKAYRDQCAYLTRAQVGPGKPIDAGNTDLALIVEFHPPQARKYDRDNLLARMKAGLDGMCDALGIDDSRFEPITISMRKKPFRKGYVQVSISPET